MTFKVGDRVIYTGKSTEWVDKHRIGWLGTITDVAQRNNIRVKWDDYDSIQGHYPENLALAEMTYSPTQEGDKEDDI